MGIRETKSETAAPDQSRMEAVAAEADVVHKNVKWAVLVRGSVEYTLAPLTSPHVCMYLPVYLPPR